MDYKLIKNYEPETKDAEDEDWRDDFDFKTLQLKYYGSDASYELYRVEPRSFGTLDLDGNDDHVDTTLDELDPSAGSFSAFVWIKGDPASEVSVILCQLDGVGTGENWLYADSSGYLATDLDDGSSGELSDTDVVITDGLWHHVGIVWNGSVRRLYVDGRREAEDTAATGPLRSCDGILRIAMSGSNADHWEGRIGDVVIYDTAVGEDDIEVMAAFGPPPASGLLAHWKLDDIDNIAMDSSASGKDGTIYGRPLRSYDSLGFSESINLYTDVFTDEHYAVSARLTKLIEGDGGRQQGWLERIGASMPGLVAVRLPDGDETGAIAYNTIQEALTSAGNNDIVLISPGIHVEAENLVFPKHIDSLTLTSIAPDNPAATVIKGVGSAATVTFNYSTNCTISGITITRKAGQPGRGVLGHGKHDGTNKITNCIIRNCKSFSAAGIYNMDGEILNCIITENSATGDNGGGLSGCDGKVVNCVISLNEAGVNGGGLYNCTADVIDCTIAGNKAGSKGGGMYNFAKSPTIRKCLFGDNRDGDDTRLTAGDQIFNTTSPRIRPLIRDSN
ncbi:MAG: hypothetical protein KAT00_15385, partial [Planctomycetes bacterium]|nr:hypothetical protein [Planctomycetota bacterium]